jgi:hypothetical protein
VRSSSGRRKEVFQDLSSDKRVPTNGRSPIKAVTLLMPAWGDQHIGQFLDFCLPTLLAPGNVPAINAAVRCRFVLLSSEAETAVVSVHPAWQRLRSLCNTEIQFIDDLIIDGDHSATITLAFARAIRATGDELRDTCFVFLCSDYLFADGSLMAVVNRICAGASGVLVGNYQIVAEDAAPHLRGMMVSAAMPLVLRPRELVQLSLQHLHPATVANIVNSKVSHNSHVNRLFWRVDDDTLIGRFYLLHLIAIRPELKDFVVGASWDYSFMPEMCPSRNVVAITDSDEYLVVEMQPRDHESRNLLPGPVTVSAVARSLCEWTTVDHRRNVDRTFVYHACDIPETLPRVVGETDGFVAAVRAQLANEPHPHRYHHYWLSSIATYRAPVGVRISRQELEFVLGESLPSESVAARIWRARTSVFGSPPNVTRLHPRWADYGLAYSMLRRILAGGRLLLVTDRSINYADWAATAANELSVIDCDRLLNALDGPSSGNFDCCLMVLTEVQASHAERYIAHAVPLLRSGGSIMILFINSGALGVTTLLPDILMRHFANLSNSSDATAEVYHVPATPMRRALYRAMERRARQVETSGWRSLVRAALPVAAVLALAIASYFCNLATRAVAGMPSAGRLPSSIFLILRPGQRLAGRTSGWAPGAS